VRNRDELQARNEALLRTVNERIRAIDETAEGWADADERFVFRCECGDPGCSEQVEMTLAEYERARSQRDRFAVVPDHEDEEIEQVVERNERFFIVDKREAVEHLVE
jgi:hypothetical protein